MASTAAVTSPKPRDATNRLIWPPPGAGPPPAGPGLPTRQAVAAPGGWVRPRPGCAVPGSASRQRPQLGRGQVADHVHRAGWAVRVDLEDAGRVVVAVETGRPARSLVPDRLARL